MNALKDRVALVTGGNRGVGRAIALLFAREGAHVVVNHRLAANDALSLAGLPEVGHMTVQADISKSDEVRRMFQRIGEQYGRFDILVNNAGINRDGGLQILTEAMWDEVIDGSSTHACK